MKGVAEVPLRTSSEGATSGDVRFLYRRSPIDATAAEVNDGGITRTRRAKPALGDNE
jgi:hypothetical protein